MAIVRFPGEMETRLHLADVALRRLAQRVEQKDGPQLLQNYFNAALEWAREMVVVHGEAVMDEVQNRFDEVRRKIEVWKFKREPNREVDRILMSPYLEARGAEFLYREMRCGPVGGEGCDNT